MATLLCKGTYVEGDHEPMTKHAMVLGFTKQGLCPCGLKQLRKKSLTGGWKETGNICDKCEGNKSEEEEVKVDAVVQEAGQDDAVIALGLASVDNSQCNPSSTNKAVLNSISVANANFDYVEDMDHDDSGDDPFVDCSADNPNSTNVDDAQKAFTEYIASLKGVAQKAEKELEKVMAKEARLMRAAEVEAIAAAEANFATQKEEKAHAATQKELEGEKEAHAATEKKLEEEKEELAATKKKLEENTAAAAKAWDRRQEAHAATKKKLEKAELCHMDAERALAEKKERLEAAWREKKRERQEHHATQKKLEEEKEAHAATQKELKEEKEAHAATKKGWEEGQARVLAALVPAEKAEAEMAAALSEEKEAHAATKKKLEEAEKAHAAVWDFAATAKEKDAEMNDRLTTIMKLSDEKNKMLTALMKFSDEKNEAEQIAKRNFGPLGEAAHLKQLVGADIFNKWVVRGGIKKDADGHIVKMSICPRPGNYYHLDHNERKQIQFDIKELCLLQNLTSFDLRNTRVSGDIKHLNSLSNLTSFNLNNTDVSGDIKDVNSMQNLTELCLGETFFTGRDWRELGQSSLTLQEHRTSTKAFYDYRKTHGLNKCDVHFGTLVAPW